MEAGDQAAVRDGCGARMSAVWRGDAARRFDRALLVALVVLAALVAVECALLASRGFVAATIEYRLAPRNHWPAQLVDAQLAVRYLRSQSGALGLDAGRLCAWGESAGGHLAAFLGVLAGVWPGDEAGLYDGASAAGAG